MQIRRAIDLNMRSPKYIVKRMQEVKKGKVVDEQSEETRYAAVETLMQVLPAPSSPRSFQFALIGCVPRPPFANCQVLPY